ncbi:MAG: hypothetical protein RBT15_04825 [Gudongella sp.]|jgi:hypothetical protein|nr:hypothetical protein [Gudongella sp.]
MFENVKVKGVHASRYIMSWIRVGGSLHWTTGQSDFADWLESLGLSESEIESICEIARNGKMELEMSAARFLKNIKTE